MAIGGPKTAEKRPNWIRLHCPQRIKNGERACKFFQT